MQHVEGKVSVDYSHKLSGQTDGESSHNADGHFAVQADLSGADKIGVSGGRTVELAEFEFARVDVGINVHFRDKSCADEVRERCQGIVDEILAREVAAIANEQRDNRDVTFDTDGLFGISIYTGYGLTLKGEKRFESHRIDQSRLWQVDDGADIAEEIARVGQWVAAGVREKKDEIRGRGSDSGI